MVPGYFVAHYSRAHWPPRWNKPQRYALWSIAVASTVVPDTDVIYNILFRGFANHSVLWTHSLFPYLGVMLLWVALSAFCAERFLFLRTALGFIVLGGLSHLFLDVLVHGTPLFYPLSMMMVGWPPQQVVEGGLWGYVTHPIILLEPLLIGMALLHWWRCRAI